MQVIKRNGNKIDFNPSRILTRIKKQAEGLKVNADEVFIKVTQGLADNMTTNQLDDLISVVSESLAMNHPDYSKLAANIAISKLHKETEDSFMKATKKMYNSGLLSEFYYNKVKENIDLIKGQFTTIVIAHRLSTIKNVDKIYQLKNGNLYHITSI